MKTISYACHSSEVYFIHISPAREKELKEARECYPEDTVWYYPYLKKLSVMVHCEGVKL
jgi:hypothetical protein